MILITPLSVCVCIHAICPIRPHTCNIEAGWTWGSLKMLTYKVTGNGLIYAVL